jgi:hypothetical protein
MSLIRRRYAVSRCWRLLGVLFSALLALALLRKIAAYSLKNSAFTIDSLCKAIASCLREISRSECAAFLANSGYGQLNREML